MYYINNNLEVLVQFNFDGFSASTVTESLHCCFDVVVETPSSVRMPVSPGSSTGAEGPDSVGGARSLRRQRGSNLPQRAKRWRR